MNANNGSRQPNNGSRQPNNGSDANSNGYRSRDQPQRGAPKETGDQKWYTHVKTSEIAEERQPLAQEWTDGSSHYKVACLRVLCQPIKRVLGFPEPVY